MKTFSQLCAIDLCRMPRHFTGRLAAPPVIFCHIRFPLSVILVKFFASGRCFPPWSIRAGQLIFAIVFSSCEPPRRIPRDVHDAFGKNLEGNFSFRTRKIVHKSANESFVNDRRRVKWNCRRRDSCRSFCSCWPWHDRTSRRGTELRTIGRTIEVNTITFSVTHLSTFLSSAIKLYTSFYPGIKRIALYFSLTRWSILVVMRVSRHYDAL